MAYTQNYSSQSQTNYSQPQQPPEHPLMHNLGLLALLAAGAYGGSKLLKTPAIQKFLGKETEAVVKAGAKKKTEEAVVKDVTNNANVLAPVSKDTSALSKLQSIESPNPTQLGSMSDSAIYNEVYRANPNLEHTVPIAPVAEAALDTNPVAPAPQSKLEAIAEQPAEIEYYKGGKKVTQSSTPTPKTTSAPATPNVKDVKSKLERVLRFHKVNGSTDLAAKTKANLDLMRTTDMDVSALEKLNSAADKAISKYGIK